MSDREEWISAAYDVYDGYTTRERLGSIYDAGLAARAQQPNLSRIAKKKLDQMGATIHGVLVKNEARAWAAVSDAGRVMWLDDFEGQAARAQQAGSEVDDGKGSLPWFVHVYNSGYEAGHHDTVEGGFTPVHHSDKDTYHEELVMEILEDLNVSAYRYTHPQPAQQGSVPEWMAEISEKLRTQDNRITADPLFVVFQKREIVVAEDYDHDRIAWVGDEGQEPDSETTETLDDLRDDVDSDWWTEDEITLTDDDGSMEWRRLALKTVDEFVTACFTEAGAKDYLNANGHNLRLPYIFVTSLYRNEEMKRLREWLLTNPPAEQEALAMSEQAKSQGAQCWICPQCYDDKHHVPGDSRCLSKQVSNLKAYRSELQIELTAARDEADRRRRQCGELEDALVWALGKLSIEVPISGGNVTYMRAFEKADKALSSDGNAWLLRKQAEAIEAARNEICDFRGKLWNAAQPEELTDYAQHLRQQADELEAGCES